MSHSWLMVIRDCVSKSVSIETVLLGPKLKSIIPLSSFPDSSVGKESACNAGDMHLIPGWEDPLEEEMTTHSSILAWKITWTEEPGRL